MTDSELIDRIFAAAHAETGKDFDDAKWICGVVLLADVLLNIEEPDEREKKINGLWREIRDALSGIPKIMETGKLN